jgi:hypothetical protein
VNPTHALRTIVLELLRRKQRKDKLNDTEVRTLRYLESKRNWDELFSATPEESESGRIIRGDWGKFARDQRPN